MNGVIIRQVQMGEEEWDTVAVFFPTEIDRCRVFVAESSSPGHPTFNAIFSWLEEEDCDSYEFTQGTPWGLSSLTVAFFDWEQAMRFSLTWRNA